MNSLLDNVSYQAVMVLNVTAVVGLCVRVVHRCVSQVTGW